MTFIYRSVVRVMGFTSPKKYMGGGGRSNIYNSWIKKCAYIIITTYYYLHESYADDNNGLINLSLLLLAISVSCYRDLKVQTDSYPVTFV